MDFEAFAALWFVRRRLGEADPDSATSDRSVQGVNQKALAAEVAKSVNRAKLVVGDKKVEVSGENLGERYAGVTELFDAGRTLRELCVAGGESLGDARPFSDFLALRWAMGALFEVFPSSRPANRPVSDDPALKGIGARWIAKKARDAGLTVDADALLEASAGWKDLYEAGESVEECVQ